MTGSIFVSFEGGEGSGKTTQTTILRDAMVAAGFPTILVREPGSTLLGDYLRRYLKEEHRPLSARAELLLFVTARAELTTQVIAPALKRGSNVIADRYVDSTVVYQGYGRGLDLKVVADLNNFATDGIVPQLTFLLDIEPAEGLRRIGSPQLSLSLESATPASTARLEEEGQRGFENLSLDFHRRVRRGYLNLAKQEPERWSVLNAMLPQQEIASQVWQRVSSLLR